MKQIKRGFAILLIFVLLFTGVVEPLGLTARATADNVPTLGTNIVNETPREILYLGEWVYWVEDGVATIAGYQNIGEVSLSIPAKLDGYPVTGIGHKAFVQNKSLNSIQIHTNVTRIADDAFDGLNGITICAYHGAYALLYADDLGFPFTELSEIPGVVFAEGVIDLTGISHDSYRNLTETEVQFSKSISFLKEGQILFFPGRDGSVETGTIKRTERIVENENDLNISLSQPEWGECFVQVTGTEELIYDWEHAILNEGFSLEDAVPTDSSTKSISQSIGIDIQIKDGIKVSGSISKELETTVSWDIGTKWLGLLRVPDIKSIEYNQKETDEVKVKFSVKGKEDYGKTEKIIGWVPVTGGFIYGTVTIKAVLEVKAEASASVKIVSNFNISYKNGKATTTKDKFLQDKSFSLKGEVKFGPEMGLEVGIGIFGLKIQFLDAKFGIYAIASGTAKWTSIFLGTETTHCCLDCKVDLVIELEGSIGLIKVTGIPVSLKASIGAKIGPWTILQGHFDSGKPVSNCVLKNRRVVFQKDGSTFSEGNYKVNELLHDPGNPKKKGYLFEGWYANASSSGLSGGDWKFNFNKDGMPLCGNTGTFYLYAKYKKNEHPVTGLSLNYTNITDYTSNKNGIQLLPTIIPANADDPSVTWASSNTSVAKVDKNGKVTFVAPGNATITCRSESNEDVFATCQFTVRQYVENVNVTGNVASIVAGDTENLNVTVFPANATDKRLEWTSSDNSIATVNANGAVAGVSEGLVTITATALDGSNVSGIYQLYVVEEPATPPTVAVTSINVANNNPTLYTKDGYTQQFDYTVLPANADDTSVIWASSNRSIIRINESGLATLVGPGTAMITGRSKTNPRISATCIVTVIQNVESITVTANRTTVEMGENAQMYAEVGPTTASDKSVTWSSEDPAIGTVDRSGIFRGVTNGRVWITATANDGSGISNRLRMTVGSSTPISVDSVKLDKSEAVVYTNNKSGIELTPTVMPADADDPSVYWESNNNTVATVDENGLVTVLKAGTATISCRSVSNPAVMGTCVVTVKQYADAVYVSGTTARILPGETTQLTAELDPDDTTDTTLIWTSSDPAVATVDNNGLVTAVAVGDVTITASTIDGTDISASYDLSVEKYLQLNVSMVNDTVYSQGTEPCDVAYISLTNTSARRILREGKELNWTLTRISGNDDLELSVQNTTMVVDGTERMISVACISGQDFTSSEQNVYHVSCSTDGYEDSVDVVLTVDHGQYAENVKLSDTTLGYNTLSSHVDETVLIPALPYSADGNMVLNNMKVSISGDYDFMSHATMAESQEGIALSFDESGIYNATVQYQAANLAYTVEATFRIMDENGVVRIKVTDIAISDAFLSLVEGETTALSAEISPVDAYNQDVVWESSDPSVATVSTEGAILAVAPGVAVVSCTAADGSEALSYCSVSVESFLQIDEDDIQYTVYTGGDQHADLGIINVTIDSERRLLEDELNVTWTLERISGNSTEVGLSEYTAVAENGLSVSGNMLKLLRIYSAGTDQYRLTCTAGDYSDSCIVTVVSIEADLPDSVSLTQTVYHTTVYEWLSVDTEAITNPSSRHLPNDVEVKIDGGNAFWNAMSGLYSFSDFNKLIFEKAGTYSGNVIYSGTNYQYICPITIEVADEDGTIPVNITDVSIDGGPAYMVPGESETFRISVAPTDAVYSTVTWSSTDTSVATVSSTGTVTAIGPGITTIVASIPESDYEGTSLVYVEEGINFRDSELERTVFVDGATRMILDTVMLTDNTSLRLSQEPEWTLRRVSGISLTLRAVPYEVEGSNGNILYGCQLILYSVSKEGDTVYELTCTSGTDTKTLPVTIHALNRERYLPASLSMNQTVFEAGINELLTITPAITAFPADSKLPDGMRVVCEGGKQYLAALNAEDHYVSQSLSTFSFNKAGTFDADFVFSYSNIQYRIPVVFRIHDANGNVPVQATRLDLNHRNLYMESGQSEVLEAVFTPVDVTDKTVVWSSSDPSVVTVDQNGNVTAIANGMATIYCDPSDPECARISCAVTVEDYLTVEPGTTSRTLFKQGFGENDVAAISLTEGTIERIQKAGITPVWTVSTDNVSHVVLSSKSADGNIGIMVKTDALLSGGTDNYTVQCNIGHYSWSQQFTLNVIDLGSNAPESVSIATPEVSALVNEAVTVDFTPIYKPADSSMPTGMTDTGFVGIGEFYNAVDWSQYSENENTVTVAFTKAGRYLLTRRYLLWNLEYVTSCTIIVGESMDGRNVLKATETECIVYNGGKSGSISNVWLTDAMIYQLWGKSVSWNAERISGESLTVALKENGDNVDVFVANVLKNGTDVWRVSCAFGGMTEYIDITITADDPRGPLPERIETANNQISGMIGNWISIPIGVTCYPNGTMLPDQGDAFWSFCFDQAGEDRSSHTIENGLLKVRFTVSGYYTGNLVYRSGNVSYSIPIYFIIQDEELEVREPELNLYSVNTFDTVYPEGETGVAIGQIVIAEGLSTYNTGSAVAYMNRHPASWTITKTGSAATLSLEKASGNAYKLILDSISGSGNVQYTVTCAFDGGKSYSLTNSLHVAEANEGRPDATLRHTAYQTEVGDTVIIDRNVYSRVDGSILQSIADWNPEGLLAAVGYEINEGDDNWSMTFYETGSYQSTVTAQVANLIIEIPITITVIAEGEEFVLTVLKLPAGLTEIGESAFENINTNVIDMRGTKVQRIDKWAFRDSVNVSAVYLPDSVTEIDSSAFYGCLNAVFYCLQGSYGATWATDHGFTVQNP